MGCQTSHTLFEGRPKQRKGSKASPTSSCKKKPSSSATFTTEDLSLVENEAKDSYLKKKSLPHGAMTKRASQPCCMPMSHDIHEASGGISQLRRHQRRIKEYKRKRASNSRKNEPPVDLLDPKNSLVMEQAEHHHMVDALDKMYQIDQIYTKEVSSHRSSLPLNSSEQEGQTLRQELQIMGFDQL
mmetsp:Transcript_12987/g.21956  ORF Transcript_12987/g.21956 Transcript_12987/m.21956 type:complete len:185 (-) Transcript_12987:248-802(-)